jgi:hypothetical protein
VRLADDERAAGAQSPYDLAVPLRGPRDRAGAVAGGFARDVDVALDRDGDAEQGSALAGVEARLRRGRFGRSEPP